MDDDDLTPAYLAGYYTARTEMKKLREQNTKLLDALEYALEVSDERLPLGEQWREKARKLIAQARGEKCVE